MSTKLPVLANSAERPDVLSIRLHLTRLERHYAILELQRDRAEGRCNRVAEHPDGVNETDLFRAELFANRIESQIHRALKELRKTQLELNKTLAAESEIPAASRSLIDIERGSPEILAASLKLAEVTPESRPSESPTPSPEKVELSIHNDSHPESSAFTADEFKNITARYRHRILSTPEENRLAFIIRLIEEHRAKNAQNIQLQEVDLPKPSQNGKHAA